MGDKSVIRLHILRCGRISVSPLVTFAGGKSGVKAMAVQALAPARERVELPVFCYLIEHPRGLVLVDTGWPRSISPRGKYDAAAVKSLLPPHLAAFYRPYVPEGESVDEQLSALGLKPGDIDCVVLTHLDPDHVCGLSGLWGAKRIVLPEDEYFWACRTVYKLRQPPELWQHYPIERIYYRGSALGSNRWAIDLFGDKSLMLVNLPGHTDGLCAVLIRNGKRFALLSSDAAFSRRSWERLEVPGYGFDPGRQRASLEWINKISREPGCAGIFASHDPDVVPRTVEF